MLPSDPRLEGIDNSNCLFLTDMDHLCDQTGMLRFVVPTGGRAYGKETLRLGILAPSKRYGTAQMTIGG